MHVLGFPDIGKYLSSKQALGIAGVQTTCFPWSSVTPGSKAQVDLVIERKDGIADL